MKALLRAALVAVFMALAAVRALSEPMLTRGTLPNGLRYLVLPMAGEKQGISLRLCVRAGSFDETDSELGYAHFVEHMAFDGTIHYPAGTIAALFQGLGLAWGPDLNANTHENRTVYLLELPAGQREKLGTALGVLRDYADGILFAPDQVSREAGVVVSEMKVREDRNWRADRSVERALYATTLLPRREPLGSEASVLGATSQALRAFYRRCYTPDRMTVILAGSLETAEAGRAIAEAFGTMAPGVPVAPVGLGAPRPGPGIDPWVLKDRDSPSAAVRYLRCGPRPADTPEGRAEELRRRLVIGIIDRRLLRRREVAHQRFGLAQATIDVEDAAPFLRWGISVQTSAENVGYAIWVIENELKAAREKGFSEVELKEAVAVELERLRGQATDATTRRSRDVANDLSDAVGQNRDWLPEERQVAEAVDACVALGAKDLAAAFDALFPRDQAALILQGGSELTANAEQMKEAYAICTREPTAFLPPASEVALAYGNFGTPGTVASESTEPKLGLALAMFANGVHLNIKPMAAEPGRFHLRVGLGRGGYDVIPGKEVYPSLGDGLLRACDLKRQPNSEIAELLAIHGLGYHYSTIDGAESILVEGPSSELTLALRVVTARLTETDYQRERFHTAVSFYAAQREQQRDSVASVAMTRAVFHLFGDDARMALPPTEEAWQAPFSSAYTWLRDHWLRGPVEVGVVGDVDPAQVKDAVAATLGTVAERRTDARRAPPKKFAPHPGNLVETDPIDSGSAAGCLLWPVRFQPGNARQIAAMGLAAEVLSDRLRSTLRDRLGATYTPIVAVRRDRFQRDLGYTMAVLSSDPARATELRDRAIAIADELAEDGATAEEFARLREPRLARVRTSLESPRWWLDSVVAYAQTAPADLAEAAAFRSANEKLDLQSLNAALALLAQGNCSSVVVLPRAEK